MLSRDTPVGDEEKKAGLGRGRRVAMQSQHRPLQIPQRALELGEP